MTGVLGQPYLTRQDIAVGVGTDQRLGFRWFRQAADGGREHVDLYGYTGVVRFESMDGRPWVEFAPLLHEDGLCEVILTPDTTDGIEWLSRTSGRWSVVLTAPDGTKTCLAAGYLSIVSMGAL